MVQVPQMLRGFRCQLGDCSENHRGIEIDLIKMCEIDLGDVGMIITPNHLACQTFRILAMKQSGNEAQPTIRDVAFAAGVSRATASRALSDYGSVNALTREKVQRAAAEIGYVPNVLARAMRAGSTQTLGLIITEVGLSVFDLAVRAVIAAAHLRGYQVLVSNTNEDLSVEKDSVRLMLEKQVDGLILVPSSTTDLDFLSASALQGKPLMLLDRSLPQLGLLSVTANNRQGAIDAVRHLIAEGHTKIGLVISSANIVGTSTVRPAALVSSLHDRLEGYLHTMDAAGLPVDPHWVGYSDGERHSAAEAVQNILDSPNPPTALIASNANVSIALLGVAKERGLTIGDDLSVIGFDDAPWATVITPALTVVDLPIEAMAEAAVESLIAHIDSGSPASASPILPMRLLIRDSVAQNGPPERKSVNT
jgi:LacI family transcriptional regulator